MPIIEFTGNIGAGKSTLIRTCADVLARELSPSREIVVQDEHVDPKLLDILYRGSPHVSDRAFKALFQDDKKQRRWLNVIKAHEASQRGAVVLMDTGPRHDYAFAEVNLCAEDFETYARQMRVYCDGIAFVPDVRVRLLTEPAQCIENIAQRLAFNAERKSEAEIPLEYLQQLHTAIHRTDAETPFSEARNELTCTFDEARDAETYVCTRLIPLLTK